jgi:DNA-binding MarR family transcriptional regulator
LATVKTDTTRNPPTPVDEAERAQAFENFHLNRIPGFLIRRIQQILTAMVFEETEGHDVTPVQVALMIAVRDFPGSDQKTLARMIALDQSTIGNVAERLEDRGVLVRTPMLGDRRYKVLALTSAGERLLDASEPGVWAAQEKFLACLSERERVSFVRTLGKLVIANGDHARVPFDLPPVATRGLKRKR